MNRVVSAISSISGIGDVFYGIADPENVWNYVVINRTPTNLRKGSKYFNVAIVRESYVEETVIKAVIDKVEAIAGIQLADKEASFDYAMKTGTNTVVEACIIPFVIKGKGC